MGSGRDIFSFIIWEEILKKCVSDPSDPLIRELSDHIHAYHQLEKRNAGTILQRQQYLNGIALLCKQWLEQTTHMTAPQAHTQVKDLKSKVEGPIHPWIMHLKKKAEKKSRYLSALSQHLNHEKRRYVNKSEFIEHLMQRPYQNSVSRLKLYNGTLVERIDPLHRQFEMDINFLFAQTKDKSPDASILTGRFSSLMSTAFTDWILSEDDMPFFLWLEGHPLLTAATITQQNIYQGSPTIPRVDYSLPDALDVRLDSSDIQGRLLAKRVNSNDNETLLTSKSVKNYSPKIGSKYGSIAFIWCMDNENHFITHPHEECHYHHSSLNGGKSVRCAGMWNVENGQITAINNSSGHYRPSSLNFYLLIRFLQSKNVLSEKVLIADMRRENEPVDPSRPFWSMKSPYFTLNEYLKWAESLDSVKAYQDPDFSTPQKQALRK